MRTVMKRIGIALVGTMALIAGTLVGAAPASAAPDITLTVYDGVVGVAQTVSAQVTSEAIGAPQGTVTFTANGTPIGSVPVGGSLGTNAQTWWTPPTAGSVTVVATMLASDGSQSTDSRPITIRQVGTAVSTSTPGSATTSTPISLAATARTTSGSYVPTGTISFYLSNNQLIGTSGVDGSGRAYVTYTTPASATTVYVYAVYNGDANAYPSGRSATDSIKVSTQASSVALVVPQTNYVGSLVQLTAKITPTTGTGTVDFTVNGNKLGQAPVANGVAVWNWVPNYAGTYTIGAKYSGGSGVQGASTTNQVTVTSPLKADQINVTPAGQTAPWPPATVATLKNGTKVQLAATSASGLPVTSKAAGPCQLSPGMLQVMGAGSNCSVTVSTPGGNGYAPTAQQYTIIAVAGDQTAKVDAPKSGTYAVGKTLKLGKTSLKTSVGQPVKWKVTSGSSICSIKSADGYYKLKLSKKGTCKVKGSAPAVSDQWNAYSTTRTYTVK